MAHFASTYRKQGRWREAEELKVNVMEAGSRAPGKEHPPTLAATANFASTHQNEGRWKEVEEVELEVMQTSSSMLGEEHPSTLTAMANLASIYRYQGRWKEAEELELKVMEATSRMPGDEHPSTLIAIADLASIYRNQGRWKEAEELDVKVVEARLRVLGEEHPNTLTAMANLASTYQIQGRWKEAEELELEVMQTSSSVLGEEHPLTLTAMANLASTYRYQGRWKEAEELELKVKVASSRVLGKEHPDTLTAMANLASTYHVQGRWKEAEELDVKVMVARSRVLGEEHPDTLTAMANLASTYHFQGRWKKAEELESKVMEASVRVLGKEHPDTLTAKANLASTYRRQGRWTAAEELEVKILEARSRVLGKEHPSTLTAMANLASTYWNQGRWKEAEELELKVMEASSRMLGEEHPSTLIAMANLASTYRDQGRRKKAEELELKVMEASSRVLGEKHPSTLTAMANLASTYRRQARWEEAEELELRVTEVSSTLLGEEHPSTLTATANLAATYRRQGRWKKAEELDVRVMETTKRVFGSEHLDTLVSIANLATTYRYEGRWKEAEQLAVQVMETSKRVLGEEHSFTLASIANLSFTLRILGQLQSAIELMTICATVTSKVLGSSHPLAIDRHDHLKAWKDELTQSQDASLPQGYLPLLASLRDQERIGHICVRDDPGEHNLLLDSILYPERSAVQIEAASIKVRRFIVSNLRCVRSTTPTEVSMARLFHHSPVTEVLSKQLTDICAALRMLCEEGLCLEAFNLFIEDENTHTLRVVSVACRDVSRLSLYIQQVNALGSDTDAVEHLGMATAQFMQLFGVITVNTRGSTANLASQVSMVSMIISIAILSYLGSHCSTLDEDLLSDSVRRVNFDDAELFSLKPVAFRLCRLGCLEKFVGGDVWALGSGNTCNAAQTHQVSLTLAQLSDLWGPIWTVPSSTDTRQLLGVHTEGGMLYRTTPQSFQGDDDTSDIRCHWVRTQPRICQSRDNASLGKTKIAVIDDEPPAILLHFHKDARLLVGAWPDVSEMHAGERNPRFDEYPKCRLELQSFLQDHVYDLQTLGTATAVYLPDTYQASFSTGKYFAIGGAKTYKKRPATTMKQRLVDYCTKPTADILPILHLLVGLEVSACSFNAQRSSLWSTLMTAFGSQFKPLSTCAHAIGDIDCAINCWKLLQTPSRNLSSQLENMQKNSQRSETNLLYDIIPGLLGELSFTGIQENGHLHCFVPPCDVFSKKSNLPGWTALLKDTDVSACFAVLSRKCLVYDGRDLLDSRRKLRKCCTRTRKPNAGPFLCTSIVLNPEVVLAKKMNPGRAEVDSGEKVVLSDGYLAIRNQEMPLQLASYHSRSTFSRALRYEHHREHMGRDARNEDVVPLSIM